MKRESWFATACLSTKNHVKRLFFVKIFSQNITKINSKIYLINCIYKTNQYRLFLCIIIDVTSLNTIFYVAFCFLSKEKTNDYEWMLQQLREVCEKINVSDSNVIVIDNEKSLKTAISKVFSSIRQFLCLWHLNKNVFSNCKIWFDENEKWKKFFTVWQKIIYANTEAASNENWNVIRLKHVDDFLSMNYFENLLRSHREKFLKCFTNHVLHFDNTATYKSESDHAKLKRELRVFTDKAIFLYYSLQILTWYQKILKKLLIRSVFFYETNVSTILLILKVIKIEFLFIYKSIFWNL